MASGRVHHITSESLDSGTAQSPGMKRFAAISERTAGSQTIFMGQTHVGPGIASGPHHHGPSETCIYVVSGTPAFVYLDDAREVRIETKPGDFVYVPPFFPHIELNPSDDEEAVVVVARSTQEAIVENLESLGDARA